jgi:hypothetical protein
MTAEFDLAGLLDFAEAGIGWALHRLEQTDPKAHAQVLADLATGAAVARLVIEAGRPLVAQLWIVSDTGARRFQFLPVGVGH